MERSGGAGARLSRAQPWLRPQVKVWGQGVSHARQTHPGLATDQGKQNEVLPLTPYRALHPRLPGAPALPSPSPPLPRSRLERQAGTCSVSRMPRRKAKSPRFPAGEIGSLRGQMMGPALFSCPHLSLEATYPQRSQSRFPRVLEGIIALANSTPTFWQLQEATGRPRGRVSSSSRLLATYERQKIRFCLKVDLVGGVM